jgi:RNA-splicing ligase RtcB
VLIGGSRGTASNILTGVAESEAFSFGPPPWRRQMSRHYATKQVRRREAFQVLIARKPVDLVSKLLL